MPRRGAVNPDRPQHTIAMPRKRWESIGALLDEQGLDRTQAVNDFFAWLDREPHARLPRRRPKA